MTSLTSPSLKSWPVSGRRPTSGTEIDRLAKALLALPEKLGSKLRVIERAVLHHAIEACGGNKTAAARLVGVDRKVLERRWDRHTNEESRQAPRGIRRLTDPSHCR